MDTFCFAGGDGRAKGWRRQGITGFGDATTEGTIAGQHVLLVSWYRTPPGESDVRLSVIGQDGRYRHLQLVVVPTRSRPVDYLALHAHAGGIVCYGHRLYVADTAGGLRVFDRDDILDLGRARNGSTSRPELVGRHGGTFYGYRYVLPQVGSYTVVAREASARAAAKEKPSCGAGRPRFSYLSLDRTTRSPTLVSGEYCNPENEQDVHHFGRVARWRLDTPENGLRLDSSGVARATDAYRLPVSHVQGATAIGDTWYLSRSNGPNERGWLVRARPGGLPALRVAGIGTEDLYRRPNTGRIYTVTEYPGQRAVYSVVPS